MKPGDEVADSMVRPADVAAAPGLVAAHVGMHEARRLLECIRQKLGALNGRIGFHDPSGLAFASVSGFDPVRLLSVYASQEESILFCNDSPAGILVLNCDASQRTTPFSIAVQGEALIQALSACFPERSQG